MMKKEDGTMSFKAAPEDFPSKHKAPILNIGIAETGTDYMHLFVVGELHNVYDKLLLYIFVYMRTVTICLTEL